MKQQAERKYVAFISYRHLPLDTDIAARVQRSIEQFTVPRSLRGETAARLGLVFRDEEELPASSDLSHDIRAALDNSQYLIVVCTPDTPASEWVRREIRCFQENHDRGHVLAVLAAGEPSQSFPPELTEGEIEPLAANICAPTAAERRCKLRREIVRLYAALIGCPYDALVQRAQKRRMRRTAVAVSAALAVALSFSGVLVWKNTQLEARNAELLRQRQEVQLSESRLLTARAEEELAANETASALRDALAALPSGEEDGRPYYGPAEKTLMTGLNVFEGHGSEQAILLDRSLTLNAPVNDIALTPDGKTLFAIDIYGGMYAYELPSGVAKWAVRFSSDGEGFQLDPADGCHMCVDPGGKSVAFTMDKWVAAVSAEDGSILWYYSGTSRIRNFLAMSDDGALLACIDEEFDVPSWRYSYALVILDAHTGDAVLTVPLAKGLTMLDFAIGHNTYTDRNTVAAFSGDNALFAGMYMTDEHDLARCFVVDLASGELRVLREGIDIRPLWMALEEDRLLLARQGDVTHQGVVFEAIALDTGELLWQTEAGAPEIQYLIYARMMNHAFLCSGNTLYAAAEDMLYAFRTADGALIAQGRMPATVVDLVPSQKGFFQFVCADGSYGSAIARSLGDIYDSRYTPGGWYELGNTSLARIVGGFQSPVFQGTHVDEFTLDEEGCVAMVSAEDDRVIVLRGARWTEGMDSMRKLGLSTDWHLDDALGGRPLRRTANGSLLVSMLNDPITGTENVDAFLLLDADASGEIDPIVYSRESTMDAWILEDGSAVLECEPYGDMAITDLATGERTSLSESKNIELMVRNGVHFIGSITSCGAAYRTSDGKVLSAWSDGGDMRLWLNGVEQAPVPMPEGYAWMWYGETTMISRLFAVGENGCVLYGAYAPDAQEDALAAFALYDSADGRWTLYPDEGADTADRVMALGRSAAVFAVADDDSILRVYGPQQGGARVVRTGLPTSAVSKMAFLPDDIHLILYTRDGRLDVFDTDSGKLVYESMTDARYGTGVYGDFSPDGRRAYIQVINADVLICLDTTDWCELGRADNSYGFDTAREEIWRYISFDYGLSVWRVPTREELIAIARGVCGD